MKLAKAMEIIRRGHAHRYRVSYDYRDGSMIVSSCFPDHTRNPEVEPALASFEQAVDLAAGFALAAPEEYVNICVVDETFYPVSAKLRVYP